MYRCVVIIHHDITRLVVTAVMVSTTKEWPVIPIALTSSIPLIRRNINCSQDVALRLACYAGRQCRSAKLSLRGCFTSGIYDYGAYGP